MIDTPEQEQSLLLRIKTGIPWILFGGWVAGITVLSALPGSDIGAMPFPAADKVAHFIMFACGASPLIIALLHTSRRGRIPCAFLAWSLMFLISLADEFHQRFTPGRSGNDLGDLLADTLGSIFGILLTLVIYGRRNHLGSPQTSRTGRAS